MARQMTDDTNDKAKKGHLSLNYIFEHPGAETTFRVQTEMDFDWWVEEDVLTIHNPNEFYLQEFDLTDFDKEEWLMLFEFGGGANACTGWGERYTVEKE